MELYSIMRLDEEHIDEICNDVKRQYEEGIATCVLFDMQLQPFGNPPIDKVGVFCRKYDIFSKRLHKMGLKCGILIQNSLCNVRGDVPFQKVKNLTDGRKIDVCCPYDEGYRKYLKEVGASLAKHEPAVIMLDDDFRLISFREGMGCACPLHMAEFNKRAGTDFTREELFKILTTQKDTPYMQIYLDIQEDSLVGAVKELRAGIDSVNPKLYGIICTTGGESAVEMAKAFAGVGNPVTFRVNNSNYTLEGGRGFSLNMLRAAECMAEIKGKGVDSLLAETDTCPHNRYSKSAQSLHAHFVGSILEGMKGAKHWITMLRHFDMSSGEAYRKILAKNRGFYEELVRIVPTLKPFGCRIPTSPKIDYGFITGEKSYYPIEEGWATCVLERLGLPLYFSDENGGVAFLNGNRDFRLSDDEILELLKGVVVLASDTAKNLIERGFGEYIGVQVSAWNGDSIDGEMLSDGDCVQRQENAYELVPLNDKIAALSTTYHLQDPFTKKKLFPGSTIYKNSIGGTVIVFCGTPKADMFYTKGFSFLNPARKRQLIEILDNEGKIPLYYPGDAEIYLRGAYMRDDSLFCGFFNISHDILETVHLVIDGEAEKIEKLEADGSRKLCDFEYADGEVVINTPAYPLNPVILFISLKK